MSTRVEDTMKVVGLDVTDWRGSMEDSKARYRSVLTSLQDNPAIKMLIHDSWGGMYAPGQKQRPGAHGHPEHMHIEVKDKVDLLVKDYLLTLVALNSLLMLTQLQHSDR